MKKLWLLIIVLFLAACGGGGGGGGVPGQPGVGKDVGSVTLQFNKATAKTAAGLPQLNDPSWVRVVFNNSDPDFKIDGVSNKVIYDLEIGTEPVFQLPVHNGYTVKAIWYSKDGSINNMQWYGSAENINVVNASSTVSITMAKIMTAVTLQSFTPGTTFPLSLTNEVAVFGPGGHTTSSTSDITARQHNSDSIPQTLSVTPPFLIPKGKLYVQAELFIDENLLNKDEKRGSWSYTTETVEFTEINGNTFGGDLFADSFAPRITSFSVQPGAVMTPTTDLPVTIAATDNVGVTGYYIEQSPIYLTADALATYTPTGPGSFSPAPTKLSVTGTITHGKDNFINFYAWAKDKAGNISAFAKSTVIINDSPRVQSITLTPSPIRLSLPAQAATAQITGTVTANANATHCTITTTSDKPDLSAITTPLTLNTTTNQMEGPLPPTNISLAGLVQNTSNYKTLYVWVKDVNGTVTGATASVTITDLPQVTAFDVTEKTIIKIESSFEATIEADVTYGPLSYLITESSTKPSATGPASGTSTDSWGSSKIKNYILTTAMADSLTKGKSIQKVFYAWVKDNHGNISAAKTARVTFNIPIP